MVHAPARRPLMDFAFTRPALWPRLLRVRPVPIDPVLTAAQPGIADRQRWVNYKASSPVGADQAGIVLPTIPKGDGQLFHFLA